MEKEKIRVAILDLYNNEENQGMRCIQDILNETDCKYQDLKISYDIFEVRYKNEAPNEHYDIYISSGGPGSPFDGEGLPWEASYFHLLDKLIANNENSSNRKKHIFFICHSFQMMIRYFELAEIARREKRAFGIFPVYKTNAGLNDPVLKDLDNPFPAADFREWQVIEPNNKVFEQTGAELLAIERERPDFPDNRALMAIRMSNEIIGTQFHPEADPSSMYFHFRQPERKLQVINEFDENTYYEMLQHLEEPDNITKTKHAVLPSFLMNAIDEITVGKYDPVL